MFAVTSLWDVTSPLGSGVWAQNAMWADTRENDLAEGYEWSCSGDRLCSMLPTLWSVTEIITWGWLYWPKGVFTGQLSSPSSALLARNLLGLGRSLRQQHLRAATSIPPSLLKETLRFPTCLDVMIWGYQKYKSHIILAVAGLGHDSFTSCGNSVQYLSRGPGITLYIRIVITTPGCPESVPHTILSSLFVEHVTDPSCHLLWVLKHLSTDPQTKELSRCHLNSIEGTIPLLETLQLKEVKEHLPPSSLPRLSHLRKTDQMENSLMRAHTFL